MNLPKVSVYIPTHNRVLLLERALKSVINQTYKNIEIIVCNDASTDSTREYIDTISRQHSNLIVLHNETGLGAPASRNRCIKASSGQFVTGLDDDDYFDPTRIERLMQGEYERSIQGEDYSFIFGDINKITQTGTIYQKAESTVDLKKILTKNYIGNQFFISKEKLVSVGMFDERLPAWQDYDLLIRLIHRYGPAYGINGSGYNLDLSHSHERISKSSKNVIEAFDMLSSKYKNFKYFNKQKFKLNAYDYNFDDMNITLKKCFEILPSSSFLRAIRIWAKTKQMRKREY